VRGPVPTPAVPQAAPDESPRLARLFLRFLRYGFLAWGGPIAQIALMHRELVERDRWVSEERFRKTLALYQAIPGPEANQLAIYFGLLRRGRWGGLVAGLGFMLPGVLLVTLLAALYLGVEGVPAAAQALLYGARPAVLALVAAAFWRLLRVSVKGPEHALIAAGAAAMGYFRPDITFLLVLAAGGAIALLPGLWDRGRGATALLPLVLAYPALHPAGLGALAVVSLKVGFLTFGGAYTALPYLQRDAVAVHGWLTEGEFLDALALVSLVPGPLIAIGTFVGYVAAGPAGAALATVLIFTPAFGLVLAGHDLLERLVHNERLHRFLLGVTAAVIGLVAATVAALAPAALRDVPQAGIAVLALAALLTGRVPIPIVVLGGAATGLALMRLGV
jgi:chromate transporter